MKYCVTVILRSINNPKNIHSYYREFNCLKLLNDFLFSEVCNSICSTEVIGLFFEVVSDWEIEND